MLSCQHMNARFDEIRIILMISTLCSADNILKYFYYFSQKTGFDILCKGNSLHEVSNPIFYEK